MWYISEEMHAVKKCGGYYLGDTFVLTIGGITCNNYSLDIGGIVLD